MSVILKFLTVFASPPEPYLFLLPFNLLHLHRMESDCGRWMECLSLMLQGICLMVFGWDFYLHEF